MSLGDRVRRSAHRAREGGRGGLLGGALARVGIGEAGAERAPEPGSPPPGKRTDPWAEQPADAYDDGQLAELRDELRDELDRLARPQNDEAPGP